MSNQLQNQLTALIEEIAVTQAMLNREIVAFSVYVNGEQKALFKHNQGEFAANLAYDIGGFVIPLYAIGIPKQ